MAKLPFPHRELYSMPRIRRLRAPAPLRKSFRRAPPLVALLLSSVVVITAFWTLSRAAFFTSQLAALLDEPPPSHRDASRHLPHAHRLSQLQGSSADAVLAADGSVFYIDRQTLAMEQAPLAHELPVATMTHVVGDRPANLAFFMQISHANIPFLPRLLTVLWHPANVYLIHFDSKIPAQETAAFRQSLRDNPKFSNVHLLPSEHITYMGVSMLLNTLAAIDFLLQLDHDWHYFINLSGSDYPLVNIANMRRILGQPNVLHRNLTFLQLAPNRRFWSSTKESRFDYIFYDTSLGMRHDEQEHQLLKTGKKHPMHDRLGLEFIQSEAWVILHRSFAKFSVHSPFARKLLILLSMMKDPEEHFFAMLAWNDAYFNSTLAHHALRGIYWKLNGSRSGQHPYYIDQELKDGSLPFWDPGVVKSRCFFARKFRHPQSALLDRIDRLMSGTHEHADMDAVEKSLTAVQEYVTCLSNRDPLWHEILWHPPCNYSEYRSSWVSK